MLKLGYLINELKVLIIGWFLLFQGTRVMKFLNSMQEKKKQATARLDSLYDEIRPDIEEHERDNQDSVSTSVAEKWIEASCCKLKADFDFYYAISKNIAITPRMCDAPQVDNTVDEVMLLENGH